MGPGPTTARSDDTTPQTKRCPRCSETKSVSEFQRNRTRKDGLQVYCSPCGNGHSVAWQEAHPARSWAIQAHKSARGRARDAGVPFGIAIGDLEALLPTNCPIDGIKLRFARDRRSRTPGPKQSSPTVDRLDPAKGYVPGNIAIVCCKANSAKGDRAFSTVEEFRDWYQGRASGLHHPAPP